MFGLARRRGRALLFDSRAAELRRPATPRRDPLTTDRAARLRFLARQQQGRHQAADVVARTAAMLAVPLHPGGLLALAATDALRAQLRAALAAVHAGTCPAFQHGWSWREAEGHAVWWQRMAGRVSPTDVWLLPREVKTVGALRVPVAAALAAAPQLAIENDDLFLVAEGAQAGVRLLYEPDYAKHREAGPWHLTIWGTEWVQAAESASV
jgi:hypothetical protein